MILYAIPGLGTDARLFERLKLRDVELRVLPWLVPERGESMMHYARRMAVGIDRSRPFALMGVSFGGMLCIELSKFLEPSMTLLISSSKTRAELPANIRFFAGFPIHRLVNDALYRVFASLMRRRVGVQPDFDAIFHDMKKQCPPGFFAGAIHCIVNWKNKQIPPRVYHLHGDTDRVLPLKNIHPDQVLKGGNHFMIVNQADQVSEWINTILHEHGNPLT